MTGIFYIDSTIFANATRVYTEAGLNVVAPDGYYVFGGVYRQQLNGNLLEGTVVCPECETTTTSTTTTTTTTSTTSTTSTTTNDPYYYYTADLYFCPDCLTVVGHSSSIKSLSPLTINDWISSGSSRYKVLASSAPNYMALEVDVINSMSYCDCPTTSTTTTTTEPTTTTTSTTTTTTTTTTLNNKYLVKEVTSLQEVTVVSNIGQLTIGNYVTLLGGGYAGCWQVLSNSTDPNVTSVIAEFTEPTCGETTTTTTTTTTLPAYTFSNGTILTKTSSSGTVTETITGTLTVNSGPAPFHARVNVGTGNTGYVNFTVDGVNSSIVSRSGSGTDDGPIFYVPVGVYTYSLRVDASYSGAYTVVTGSIV